MKILSAVTILCLAIFAIYPDIDIKFSQLFFDHNTNTFPYRETLPSMIIYYSVRGFCIATFGLAFFVATYDSKPFEKIYKSILPSLTKKIRSLIKFNKKQAIFLLLIILITPGILVHWVMKPAWERARPVNVEQFGGEMEFTNFYHHGAGQDGNSFPSGHASMAFALLAFAYMVKKENQKKVFVAMFAYGVLASLCRVWQGGHYLSDVTFSAIITIWTILLLKKFYLDKTHN